MNRLPRAYQEFQRSCPEVARAHEALGEAAGSSGPLDPRSRALVRLGIAVGAGLEGAVHSHVRKALDAGLGPAEIRHAVLLAAPTIGFPAMMAARTWAEDLLPSGRPRQRRR